jgi:hypothetical protein
MMISPGEWGCWHLVFKTPADGESFTGNESNRLLLRLNFPEIRGFLQTVRA